MRTATERDLLLDGVRRALARRVRATVAIMLDAGARAILAVVALAACASLPRSLIGRRLARGEWRRQRATIGTVTWRHPLLKTPRLEYPVDFGETRLFRGGRLLDRSLSPGSSVMEIAGHGRWRVVARRRGVAVIRQTRTDWGDRRMRRRMRPRRR